MKCKRLLLMLLLALLAPWAAMAQQALPYSYGFEDNDLSADGWTLSGSTSTSTGISGVAKRSGTYGFRFNYSEQNAYLMSPILTGATTGLDVGFYYKNYSSSFTEKFQVGYTTDETITNPASFTYGNEISGGNDWAKYESILPAGTKRVAIKYVYTNALYLYLDDFTFAASSSCPKPTGLAVSNITHNETTLSWTENGTATSWQVCLNNDETSLITANSNPYTLTGLTPTTAYTAKVRAIGNDEYSAWSNEVSFSTTAEAEAVGDSWNDDFEGTACEWELVNGTQTNVWAWGTAVNNGGSHSLYVSNDNGTTNAYSHTASTVFATKLLNFTEGKFEFSYNWKANGESTFDYLRVALAPADATITAGNYNFNSSTLPPGWIALDGGSKLNLVTAWQSQSVAVNVPAGNYYLVMAWHNDGSGGTTPPAAVDNVSITRVACGYDVTDLAAGNVTTSSADITWTAGEATGWQVAYKTNAASEWTENQPVSTNSTTLSGLTASTYYQVKVRAYCGGEDYGSWCDPITFATECEVIAALGYSENFDSYTAAVGVLPICWNKINTTTYSSYQGYPRIYNYSSNSTPNCLYLYSYAYYSYGSTTYDPQPQYAILPEMSGLAGMQVTLWARGSSATSTFKIGTMTDPADASTFVAITEQALTTSYQQFEYLIPTDAQGHYLAIMIDAANEDRTYNGVYIDDISIAEPPACPKPTDLTVVANSVTPHSVQLSWVSDASAWIVAYKTAEEEEFTEVDATENPFTLTGLIDGKAYTAKVCAVCDGTPGEWSSFTVSFTTPIACPAPTNLAVSGTTGSQTTLNWSGTSDSYDVLYRTAAYAEGVYEQFNTSGTPSGWTQYSGLVDEVIAGTATLSTGGNWNTNSYALGTYNIKLNIFGTGVKYWLVTPEFDLSQNLSFDLALTDFSNADPIEDATAQADDRFVVLIYADNAWTILREWNNTGSEYVYNTIATTGEHVDINLSAYVGKTVKIAFYGESTESGGDNDLHIDNVYCGIPHEAGEWQTAAEGVTGTTYTITGLNPETDYEAKVLSNCEGETGHETVISFTTEAACMVPTELTVVSVTTTTAVLTWTSSSTAWQIQVNEEEPIDVTAIPYTLEGLTPATTYTFKVRANCDGSYTEWSNAASFATDCDAITTFPWNEDFESYSASSSGVKFEAPCWVNEHISGSGSYFFEVYSGTNGTNSTKQLRLRDMSSGTMTKLMLPEMTLPSNDYLFSIDVYRITSTANYGEGIRVFVSTDGEIEGATELAFISRSYATSDGNLIPAESASGWYTYELPIGISGTCYIILRGESLFGSSTYMDNFAVKQMPTCLKPTAFECTATTTTTATFGWTNGSDDQTAWQICLNGDEEHLIMADSNPFTIEDLTASTNYTAKVRAYCSEEDQSEWSNEVSFATECDVIAAEGYSENFDSYEVASSYYYPSSRVLPNCWSAINTTTDDGYDAFPSIYYYEYTNYANSTPNCLMLYSYYEYNYWYEEENDPQPQYAILPEMTGLAGMQVTLQACGYNTSSTFKIGTMSDPTDASTFTMIVEQTGLTTSYQEFEYLIPADCQNRYLAIMIDAANSSREDNGVYIDDIVISTPPTCLKPTALECTATTTTTATFSWTNGAADQTAWQICLNGDETNLIMADSNPFTVEDLTASTNYTAKVRAYCSEEDQSEWSNEVSFATECEPYTITAEAPYTQNFESPVVTTTYNQVGEMPVCWDNYPATSASAKILTAGDTYNYAESGQVLYFYGSGNNYAVLPEFTNALNTLQISFKYATESDSNGTLTLGYITDEDENYNSFTAIEGGTFAASSASDDTFVDVDPIDLSALPTNATRLVFRWYYGSWYGCNVDDVEVSLLPPTTVTQTIELAAGSNWVSFNVDITLDDLKAALVAVSPEATIKISGQSTSTTYVPRTHRWNGSLQWDLAQMYKIRVADACEISLEGMPINPADHPVTIVKGTNYIAFPLTENMSLTNAFAGFAVNGDKILSKTSSATYNRNRWQGQGLTNLEPGNGYIYKSISTEDRPFVFPTNAKK